MPRSARASAAGYCDRVINRGIARAEGSRKGDGFAAFLRTTAEADPARMTRQPASHILHPTASRRNLPFLPPH